MGSQIAQALSLEGHNVVVIDRDPRSFERLGISFNGETMTGLAFDEKMLKGAGIEEADAFAAVTNYDNTNLMASEIAAGLFGVPRVIARVYNPDKELTYRAMGIDYICGSTILADIFHRFVTAGGIIAHAEWAGGMRVVELEVGSAAGRLDIRGLRAPGAVRLMALVRGDKPVYFSRETHVIEGDRLIMAVNAGEGAYAEKLVPLALDIDDRGRVWSEVAGGRARRARGNWRVVLAGCGRVGTQLSEMLSLDGYHVTVIDRNQDAFTRLSKSFQGEAVKGIAFDMETLERAGIERADVFAALTNYDNTNLMAAEVARRIYGVERVTSRLYNPDKEKTFQALDINYFCGTTILAERFMQRIVPGRLNVIAWTANNRVLVAEFSCPSHFGGRTVEWLEREELLRVGFIGRGGVMTVATRDTVLEENDKVVAAVLAGRVARVRRLTAEGLPVASSFRRTRARIVRSLALGSALKGGEKPSGS